MTKLVDALSLLDEKDLKLLAVLMANPEISQRELASKLGISQPTVSIRLRRLRKLGFIRKWYGVNLRETVIYLGKLDLALQDVSSAECLKRCPYTLNGFVESGRYNISLILAAEDLKTLESVASKIASSLRGVKDSEFSIIVTPIKDFVHPILLEAAGDKCKNCPVRRGCGSCYYYREGRCLGCPLSEYYRGRLWKALRGQIYSEARAP